jgi:hypothetical protein
MVRKRATGRIRDDTERLRMDNFLPNYLKFGLLGYGAAADTHTTIGWSR